MGGRSRPSLGFRPYPQASAGFLGFSIFQHRKLRASLRHHWHRGQWPLPDSGEMVPEGKGRHGALRFTRRTGRPCVRGQMLKSQAYSPASRFMSSIIPCIISAVKQRLSPMGLMEKPRTAFPCPRIMLARSSKFTIMLR